MRTETAKLVHAGPPPDIYVVADDDVSGERGLRAHHQTISDHTVVRDVAVGEEHIVVAETGELTVVSRAVHADIFAEDIAVSDDQAGFAAFELEVVRFRADAGDSGRVSRKPWLLYRHPEWGNGPGRPLKGAAIFRARCAYPDFDGRRR